MRAVRRLAGGVLAALLCAGPVGAQPAVAVERITWLAGDTVAGRGGGARPSDRLIDWISARLPDITHERVVANAKRSWMLIEQGDTVCHAGAVRSAAREKLAYFSNTWPMPPLQLIVRRDHAAAVPTDATGQVDLAALLADPRLRGVIVNGRSYGPALDGQLARHGKRLRHITSGDFGSNLMPMLLQGRADYVIEYPSLLYALAPGRPEVAGLTGLPIRGVNEPVISGVACPRTPWGQAAIRRIDAVLGTPDGAAMLRDGLVAELPADARKACREAIDTFFQRRSQPTPGL